MYVTDSRGSVYAVDAADGHLLWIVRRDQPNSAAARAKATSSAIAASTYAEGVVYTAGGSFIFALDAKTGKPIPTFGKDGQASVILDVLSQRYARREVGDQHGLLVHDRAAVLQRRALHRQHAQREPHSRRPRAGGRREDRQGAVALQHDSAGREGSGLGDRRTDVGRRRAQRRRHLGDARRSIRSSGCSTWRSAIRSATARKRAGTNLFTDSIIALTLDTGTLKWYFQQTHHDVWDYDSGAPPILFDMQVGGRRVKAVAEASKNGYLYILDRETGKPVHPIKEMPVPTDNAGAGTGAVADAADSVHRQRQADGTGVSDRADSTFPPNSSPRTRRADLQPDAAQSDHRAGHRRRHQLQPAVPTVRRPDCSTSTPSISRSTSGAGRRATSPPTIRPPAS